MKDNSFKYFLSRLWGGIKKIIRILFDNPKSIAGTIILLFFILVAIFGPLIFPYDSSTNALEKFLSPSLAHPFGTDELGRDLFARMIAGTGDVLTIACLTSLFAVFLGVLLGMISGLVGGFVDKIIQLITNLFLSIPSFPMMLMMSAFFSIDNPVLFAVVLAIFNWAGLCRAIRSQIISIKERDYIVICKVMNQSKAHIIFKELTPNVASYILINFILIMRNAIIGSVGIMMLGLASFDPSNWGAILFTAKSYFLDKNAILLWLMPIIAIMTLQTGSLLLANGLDKTLNPRLRRN